MSSGLTSFDTAWAVQRRLGNIPECRFLGRGAWACVYRISRYRVLKITSDETDARVAALLHAEPVSWAPRIHDIFKVDATQYGYVAQYIEGRPAKLRMESLGLRAQCALPKQKQLQAAHNWLAARGITLYDLGGTNVRRRSNGTLCVVDFGCANFTEQAGRHTRKLLRALDSVT